MTRSALWSAALLLAGCIEDAGAPDLGSCAEPASGGQSYGEIGIGTCLSGPVAAAFFADGDETWLAVANANPFDNFTSGSVLLLPWHEVDTTTERNPIGDLPSTAVALDALPGGLGIVERPDARLILVSDRLSPGSLTQTVNDRVRVVDATDPRAPAPWAEGDTIQVREDPGPIAVSADGTRAFVSNVTDRSLTVLDTTATPIAPVRLGSAATLTPDRFYDRDASGSTGEAVTTITRSASLPNETWTLEWVDGTLRLFVPEDGGLVRWRSGGVDYTRSAFGVELDPTDPFANFGAVGSPAFSDDGAVPQLAGSPGLLFSDDGDLLASAQSVGSAWGAAVPLLLGSDGWQAWLDAPSAAVTPSGPALYFDGREAPGDAGAIGAAVLSASGAWVALEDPIVQAPGALRVEDPAVRADPFTRDVRMWMSLYDGTSWSIGHARSADGVTFTEATPVLAVAGTHAAAPAVRWVNGRYQMWLALWNGSTWDHAVAQSVDGLVWSDPEVVVHGSEADPLDPPRAAVQVASTAGWRVSGESLGVRPGTAVAGSSYESSFGFAVATASGYAVTPSDLHDDLVGVLPISVVTHEGDTHMFATGVWADGRRTAMSLVGVDGEWAVADLDMLPGTNPRSPVVVVDGDALRAWYSVEDTDGSEILASATSTDGATWTPVPLTVPEREAWDRLARRPHAAQALDGGGWRLWFSASDGSRWRIGALLTTDGVTFDVDPGDGNPWQLGPGTPGRDDDSGVRDPVVLVDGDIVHLWYGGSGDGSTWQILHAQRDKDTLAWTRDTAREPALFGVARTFSTAGVESPVLAPRDDGRWTLWHAGTDGLRFRIGEAVGGPDGWFPAHRYPTPGDRIVFASLRGGDAADVIPLAQAVDGLSTTGAAVSSLRLDEERGFLYVTQGRSAERSNYVTVLDVRDDSTGGFLDDNAYDLEAVVQLDPNLVAAGLRDVTPIPGTSRLYAAAQNPDAVVALDISEVVDDGARQLIRNAGVAALPLLRIGGATDPARPFADEDAGVDNDAPIAGAGMALLPDGHTLLVAHFRDNSVVVFDTALGAWGEEIRRIPNVGENPHEIVITPDGRHAVVVNYLGEVDTDGTVHGSLAVIDVDPDSPTYLEVVTWLTNR